MYYVLPLAPYLEAVISSSILFSKTPKSVSPLLSSHSLSQFRWRWARCKCVFLPLIFPFSYWLIIIKVSLSGKPFLMLFSFVLYIKTMIKLRFLALVDNITLLSIRASSNSIQAFRISYPNYTSQVHCPASSCPMSAHSKAAVEIHLEHNVNTLLSKNRIVNDFQCLIKFPWLVKTRNHLVKNFRAFILSRLEVPFGTWRLMILNYLTIMSMLLPQSKWAF